MNTTTLLVLQPFEISTCKKWIYSMVCYFVNLKNPHMKTMQQSYYGQYTMVFIEYSSSLLSPNIYQVWKNLVVSLIERPPCFSISNKYLKKTKRKNIKKTHYFLIRFQNTSSKSSKVFKIILFSFIGPISPKIHLQWHFIMHI